MHESFEHQMVRTLRRRVSDTDEFIRVTWLTRAILGVLGTGLVGLSYVSWSWISNVEQERKIAAEFRARIEDFPLPGHNPKYPGLQISIYNVYGNGMPDDRKKKNKKGSRGGGGN